MMRITGVRDDVVVRTVAFRRLFARRELIDVVFTSHLDAVADERAMSSMGEGENS